MALVPQVIDVPIRPANQQAPTTSSPSGRVKAMVNKIATRFEGAPANPGDPPSSGVRLKVEARAGMQALPLAVRDVVSGALISTTAGVPGANLLSSLNDQLVAVSGSTPYVLAENEGAWSKYPYVYSPVTVREVPVFADNIQIANPDAATIGGVTFRIWSEPNTVLGSVVGIRAMVVDADGTVIRAPFVVAGGFLEQHAKVVADGTRFWVVLSNTTDLVVKCFDTHGVLINNLSITGALDGAAATWDLTFCSGFVLLVHPHIDNARIYRISISGTTITAAPFDLGFVARADHGVAWAENTSGDGCAYLLTAHHYSSILEYAFQIGNLGTTPTVTGFFSVAQSSGNGIIYDQDGEGNTGGGAPTTGILCEMTGIVPPYTLGQPPTLYAQLSFFDPVDVRLTRLVPIVATVGSAATVLPVVRSVMSASRVFRHDGRDVLLVYYPQAAAVTIGSKSYGSEPTYFLLDVLTLQVCGRFNAGIAAMEWARTGYPVTILLDVDAGPYLFCVPHVFIDVAGNTHVPTGFQSRQFTQTFNDIVVSTTFVSAVGYQDLIFGGLGQAIEFGGELLLPGAIATSFDGLSFSENNLNLAPQQPSLVKSTGGAVELGPRSYIVVFQAVERSGDRVFSAVSVPVETTLTGTDSKVTLTGFPLHMTTRKNVSIAIYRNVFLVVPGMPSTAHYRVDNPLQPVINDPTAKTWTFVDVLSDVAIQANEPLYTDLDMRQRDPMPSFSVGDVFDGRIVCVAPDNSIWLSAQKVEGDSTWFSASQRIPANTSERIKNLMAMDNRLIELCEKHVWTQDAGGFPGPTNAEVGSIAAALKTTYTNGSTGFARLIAAGVLYSSSEGGAWLVTRGLVNEQVSSEAADDIAGQTVTGIVVDDAQRVHIGTHSFDLVFDQLNGCWSRFEAPFLPLLMHTLRGKIVYADAVGIVVQDPTSHTDVDGAGGQRKIVGAVDFKPFHFGGVKRYNRVWRFNVQGETRGNHTVTMTAVYDPDTAQTPITESWTWAVAVGDKWAFEFQPKFEQMENMTLSFVESFPDGPTYDGQSFTMEMLGFEVGLEPGLARVPLAKRIQST